MPSELAFMQPLITLRFYVFFFRFLKRKDLWKVLLLFDFFSSLRWGLPRHHGCFVVSSDLWVLICFLPNNRETVLLHQAGMQMLYICLTFPFVSWHWFSRCNIPGSSGTHFVHEDCLTLTEIHLAMTLNHWNLRCGSGSSVWILLYCFNNMLIQWKAPEMGHHERVNCQCLNAAFVLRFDSMIFHMKIENQ